VAVVVTTLISWAIGFEQNSTADISQIQSEKARLMITDFNARLAQLKNNSDGRVQLRNEYESIVSQKGERSVEALELQHDIQLLNIEIASLKEEITEKRAELRGIIFAAAPAAGGKSDLYIRGEMPAGISKDGQNWRLKVGNNPLDPNKLTIIGGGAVVGSIPKGLPGLVAPNLQFSSAISLFSMARRWRPKPASVSIPIRN